MRVCHFCRQPLPEAAGVFRTSTCPHCQKDLKICRNCRFFREGAHWDCLEPVAEGVADKERANFCEYFQFKDSQASPLRQDGKAKAKEDFERLFGGA